ncbi:MAG: LytR family transcriptional regulator [Pseudonocardiaceae bacterium]|nr:LytR family transcriptional regulator [Pseudonocardiaceae bacterium]
MSTPDATGTGRPLRTAGLVLLGIAGISLLIALVTWLGGDGNGETTAGGPTTGPPGSATAPPSAPVTRTGTAAPTSPAPGAPGQPGGPGQPGQPGQPGGPGGPGGERAPADGAPAPPGNDGRPAQGADLGAAGSSGGKSEASRSAVRVYNNSLIKGLAARAADDFRRAGWSVVEVGNYSGGTIPTTTVYYQRSTGQRSAADALGERFDLRVEPRFAGIRHADSGLIVIVTNDYGS